MPPGPALAAGEQTAADSRARAIRASDSPDSDTEPPDGNLKLESRPATLSSARPDTASDHGVMVDVAATIPDQPDRLLMIMTHWQMPVGPSDRVRPQCGQRRGRTVQGRESLGLARAPDSAQAPNLD